MCLHCDYCILTALYWSLLTNMRKPPFEFKFAGVLNQSSLYHELNNIKKFTSVAPQSPVEKEESATTWKQRLPLTPVPALLHSVSWWFISYLGIKCNILYNVQPSRYSYNLWYLSKDIEFIVFQQMVHLFLYSNLLGVVGVLRSHKNLITLILSSSPWKAFQTLKSFGSCADISSFFPLCS